MTDPGQPLSARSARPPTARSGLLGRWQMLIVAVLPCLLLAGIGWWLWPSRPAPLPLHVVSGTVQADLLSLDEASGATGISLADGPRADHPAPALTADPTSCGAAVGPTGQAVYGSTWKAFLSATYQEAGGFGDYTLTQTVGLYPSGDKAGAGLQSLTAGLRSCPSATGAAAQGNLSFKSFKWNYHVDSAAPDRVLWTAAQDGSDGWACYRGATLKGRSLVQVGICAQGDQQPTVQSLLQLVTAKVSA